VETVAGRGKGQLRDVRLPLAGDVRPAGSRFPPAAIAPGAFGWIVYLVALVGIVSVLANLSWRLLEGPCLALKDRVNYRYEDEEGSKG